MASSRKTSFYIILSVLVFGCFSACKTDPKTDTVTTPQTTTITVGLEGTPAMINPILSPKSYERTIYRHIFPAMMSFDPQTGDLVPFLGKAAPDVENIKEDRQTGGKRYTFEIRPEAKWPDGKPVLAEDYVFTMKTVFNPNVRTAWRGVLTFIKDIQIDAENPRKFTVYTDACQINQKGYLCTANIYPKHLYDPDGLMNHVSLKDLVDTQKAKTLKEDEQLIAFAKQFSSPDYSSAPDKVLGAGAYRLASFKTKQEVVLEKKKDWWGDALVAKEPIFTANPDRLVYKVVPDDATALAMLKDGELDLMGEISTANFHDLRESAIGKENLNFYTPTVPLVYYMAMNTQRPILSDKQVRQSITHLVDMDSYIAENMFGFAERINNPIPKSKPFYNHDLPLPHLDIEKANKLLDDAGWKDDNRDGVREKNINGEKTDLRITIKIRPQSVDGNNVAQILKANASKVGMAIDIVQKDNAAIYKQDIPAGDYDIISSGIGFAEMKLVDLTTYFHTDNFAVGKKGRNYANFGNAETDALIEAIANNCDDDAARTEAYRKFQEVMYEERPLLFLFALKERIAVNKRLDNVVVSELRPGYFEQYYTVK